MSYNYVFNPLHLPHSWWMYKTWPRNQNWDAFQYLIRSQQIRNTSHSATSPPFRACISPIIFVLSYRASYWD